MAVTLEVVSIGVDQYSVAEPVARLLSDSQEDFSFRVAPASRRSRLARLDLSEYGALETTRELRQFGVDAAQPVDVSYLGLVQGALEGNIFAVGSDDARPFVAVVTTSQFDRYSRSLDVFLSFYYVRWALKFMAPQLVPHAPGVADDCVFGPRRNKRDLIGVLDNPKLCDACKKLLQPQLRDGVQLASITKCFDVIRQLNRQAMVTTVIMKGGGVKGCALAGAVAELSNADYRRFFAPTTFVGTSAGAITAAFLAAGLSSEELQHELKKDFAELLDPKSEMLGSLLRHGGLYSGKRIETWIEESLRRKVPLGGAPRDHVRFIDIKNAGRRLIVYAANRFGTLSFDSETEPLRPVARAVRFSMSIPLFFTTLDHDGYEVFDGGLLNNYPLEVFRRDNPQARGEFVAIYLSDGDRPRNPSRFMILRLLSILLNRDEFVTVREFKRSTITINCAPVNTVDFDMSEAAKRLLENRGRVAALEHVVERGWAEPTSVSDRLRRLREAVTADELTLQIEASERRNRNTRNYRLVALGLAAAGAAAFFLL